ncbi:MAG: glycosyltransferase family 39 protein [Patescibacteria group bacterium]
MKLTLKNFFKTYRWETIIFGVALALRLVLFFVNLQHNQYALIPTIHADDGWYELSQSALRQHGFLGEVDPPFRANPLRPPLWPYLIALFAFVFQSYWAVVFIELIASACIPVFGYRLCRQVFLGSFLADADRVAKWVSVAMVVSPYPVLLSFLLYSETCFTFFLLLGLIFLFRFFKEQSWRMLVWSAVFLGLATLVKPTIQYVPILVPLFMLWYFWQTMTKKIIWQMLAFVLVFMAILMPWLVRNRVEFGVWGMSAQPAFNLAVYLAPTVLSIDNRTNFQTELDAIRKRPGFDENGITLVTSKTYASEALATIFQHKTALVQSVANTTITFFTHDGMLTILQYSGIVVPNILTKPALWLLLHEPLTLLKAISHYAFSPAILILIFRILWIVITVFFLRGAYSALAQKDKNGNRSVADKKLLVLALCIVLYFMATTSINGLGVNARFRVPVEVFIFMFSFYGLFEARRTILSKL